MNTAGRAAALAAVVFSITGCAGAESAAPLLVPPAAGAVTPSYRHDVGPLLQRYCLGCHALGGDAGEDHDFTRYEVLHAQRRALLAEIEAGAMPPRDHPQPGPDERRLLAAWARSGAPDN